MTMARGRIAELCRKEGIAQSLYFIWSKEFMEAGKRRLAGDTARATTTGEVQDLRREARPLKECVEAKYLNDKVRKDCWAGSFGIQQGRPIAVRENRQWKPAVAYRGPRARALSALHGGHSASRPREE
jgi:transposase